MGAVAMQPLTLQPVKQRCWKLQAWSLYTADLESGQLMTEHNKRIQNQ